MARSSKLGFYVSTEAHACVTKWPILPEVPYAYVLAWISTRCILYTVHCNIRHFGMELTRDIYVQEMLQVDELRCNPFAPRIVILFSEDGSGVINFQVTTKFSCVGTLAGL